MTRLISSYNFKGLLREIDKDERPITEQLFRGVHPPTISITIQDEKIVIKGDFELQDDIEFNTKDIFEKDIIIDNGTYKNITFKGGTFKKLIFRRGTFDGYVSIRGGNFDSIVLLGGTFKHWVGTLDGLNNYITSDSERIKLANEELRIKRFEIDGGSYAHNIWISGGQIDRLEIKCVTAVKIHCMPSDDKYFDEKSGRYINLYSSFPKISELIISRYLGKDTFYHFSDLEMRILSFSNCTNIGNITLSNILIKNELRLENSDLGKTSFIDCKFETNILSFKSSKITDISLAGTILPKPISLDGENNIQSRLALSQIKKVYQNMGDNLTASIYQADELETYLTTPGFSWDKVNLWLSKKSNKFGLSWEKAVKVLFIGSLAFYTAYCFSIGFHIDFSKSGIAVLARNMGFFLEFINPIRKFDSLPKSLVGISETEISSLTIFIDSVAKLFNAYVIYQFIAAFRRHGKSNN